jgi:hypothetical protein
MALVIEKSDASFDLQNISRGQLLWGKHKLWDEGRAGFITAATEKEIVVQYFPGISNVTNHFAIKVSEVVNGEWEIRWSSDLSEVFEFETETDEGQEESEDKEGEEGEDEAGRTDL